SREDFALEISGGETGNPDLSRLAVRDVEHFFGAAFVAAEYASVHVAFAVDDDQGGAALADGRVLGYGGEFGKQRRYCFDEAVDGGFCGHESSSGMLAHLRRAVNWRTSGAQSICAPRARSLFGPP